MAEYVTATPSIIIKENKIQSIRKEIGKHLDSDWFLFPGMEVDANGNVGLSEYFIPYLGGQKECQFHDWLAPYVADGGEIEFDGSNYDLGFWKIQFNGNGKWKELVGEVTYTEQEYLPLPLKAKRYGF